MSTGISFWTLAFVEGVARRLVFFSRRTRSFRAPFRWGSFFLGSWTANPSFAFGLTSFLGGRVSLNTFHLTFHRPLHAIWKISFPFPLDLPLSAAAPEAGFQVVVHEQRNASHEISVRFTAPPCFSVWYCLDVHSFEKYLACTETAMSLAVLTIGADGNTHFSEFSSSGLLLHHDDGFIPSRVERIHVVVLQFVLQNFLIEVQVRFVHVADLTVLVDHPCDLPSR